MTIRNIGRGGLAIVLVLALSGLALAQDQRSRDSYDNNSRPRSYQQGYRDGMERGLQDRARRAQPDYQNNDDYRRGDRGYDRNSGDRNQFVVAYRQGYQAGYDDGYNGRDDRRGGNGRYGNNDPAFNQGYRDGIVGARQDIRENKRYDYNDHGWWQDGKRGYSKRYGDRQSYKLRYREGYEAGYHDTRGSRQGAGAYPGNYPGAYPGNNTGGYGNNDPAYNQGYQDGIVGAREDIRDNKQYDYNDHGWWQDANRGYSSSYGDRESYKQRYRQGYEAGYRDTYRGRGR